MNSTTWHATYLISILALILSAYSVGKEATATSLAVFIGCFGAVIGSGYLNYLSPKTSLRKAINSSNLPMAFFDKDQNLLWANSAYENLMGYPIIYLKGKNINELINVASQLVAQNEAQDFIKEQLDFFDGVALRKELHPETTLSVHTKTGDLLEVWIHADAMIDKKDRLVGTLTIFKQLKGPKLTPAIKPNKA